MEMDLVKRAGIPFQTIPAAGLHGVGLRAMPGNLWQLARGIAASRRILARFKPDALFFTGGFVAFPMAIAGISYPSLLYVPDIEPGLAIKSVARFSDCVALTSGDSQQYFTSRSCHVVTGYPTRPELRKWDRTSGREALGIQPEVLVLLVLGGSKGARSINSSIFNQLPVLLEEAELIHITGSLDWPQAEQAKSRLNPTQAGRYHAYPYLHEEMGAVLAAADLAVSRAGASTLGEYPLFGLPAVLVPYPYAWRYQVVNADYLVKSGAAFLVRDEQLPSQLLPLVRRLLGDPQRLEAMRQSMQRLSRPDAAANLASQLRQLADSRRRTKPA